jgi:outer membrane beta-barrel protein
MKPMRNTTLIAGIAAILAAGAVRDAVADEFNEFKGHRTNGLEQAVAVRHRRLLVAQRFEFAPLFETTINADYKSIVGGGAKLEYHLSDRFSIGVVGVASTSFNTALVGRILQTLPTEAEKNQMIANGMNVREPSQEEYTDHLNDIPFHGAAYVSLTPWYGKLAAFSTAFVAFDFYFQAGVAIAETESNCPSNICFDTHPGTTIMQGGTSIPPILNPNADPPLNAGTQIGLYLGGGIHVFLNDFLALDLTVRDYIFSDNPSGADVNADLFVGPDPKLGDDNRFLSHLFFGAGLSIMLPTTVKRTP